MKIWLVMISFLALAGALTLSFFELDGEGYFNISKIEWVVDRDSEVFQLYGKELEILQNQWLGQKLWSFEFDSAKEALSEKKWIAQFSIRRVIPNELVISLEPYDLILLLYTDNQFFPVTSNGQKLPQVSIEDSPDRPILRDSKLLTQKGRFQKVKALLETLPSTELLNKKRLAEVGVDKQKGLWFTLVESGAQVFLGQSDLDLRLKRVEKVLEYTLDQGIANRIIDANFSKKVVVKPRNGR